MPTRLPKLRVLLFSLGAFFLSSSLKAQDHSQILSERFQLYQSRGPQIYNGPNCYAASAFLSGLSQRQTYMSALEFQTLLATSACQKLSPDAPPAVGDLALLKRSTDGQSELVHALVWKNFPNETYSKVGYYNSFPLELTNPSQITKWFLYGTGCVFQDGKLSGNNCQLTLENYRCNPKTPNPLDEPELNAATSFRRLAELETLLENFVFGAEDFNDEKLLELSKAVESLRQSSSAPKTPLFQSRLNSIKDQITMLRDPD